MKLAIHLRPHFFKGRIASYHLFAELVGDGLSIALNGSDEYGTTVGVEDADTLMRLTGQQITLLPLVACDSVGTPTV
jgi:hypothetical protein